MARLRRQLREFAGVALRFVYLRHMTREEETAVIDRILDPVGRCLTPESARQLVALRADPAVQERIDELADKCAEGQLTPDERAEYEFYIAANNVIAILQAKARKLLAANGSS